MSKLRALVVQYSVGIPNESWGNGYVAVPPGHPIHGMSYDDIEDKYHINIHGGLTYAGYGEFLPIKQEGWWVVGFDTKHYGDNADNRDEQAVQRETEKLLAQIEHIKS